LVCFVLLYRCCAHLSAAAPARVAALHVGVSPRLGVIDPLLPLLLAHHLHDLPLTPEARHDGGFIGVALDVLCRRAAETSGAPLARVIQSRLRLLRCRSPLRPGATLTRLPVGYKLCVLGADLGLCPCRRVLEYLDDICLRRIRVARRQTRIVREARRLDGLAARHLGAEAEVREAEVAVVLHLVRLLPQERIPARHADARARRQAHLGVDEAVAVEVWAPVLIHGLLVLLGEDPVEADEDTVVVQLPALNQRHGSGVVEALGIVDVGHLGQLLRKRALSDGVLL
jgi:hypothetical protein